MGLIAAAVVVVVLHIILLTHVPCTFSNYTRLKGMLAFNKEVLRIRKLESINREKQSFQRWGQKLPSNLKKGINDNDLADDPG